MNRILFLVEMSSIQQIQFNIIINIIMKVMMVWLLHLVTVLKSVNIVCLLVHRSCYRWKTFKDYINTVRIKKVLTSCFPYLSNNARPVGTSRKQLSLWLFRPRTPSLPLSEAPLTSKFCSMRFPPLLRLSMMALFLRMSSSLRCSRLFLDSSTRPFTE